MKMHHLLLFLLFIPCLLFSQNFDGGFFAGLSMSQVDGDNYWGYNKPGLTAGAYITREMTRETDLRMELRFTQKGAFKRSTERDPSYYKVSLQYVEMPLLFQYRYRRTILFMAGISPDVLLLSAEEDDTGILPPEFHPAFRRFSAGINGDVTWSFTENIMVGTRFTYSILPVREHGGGAVYLLNRGWYNNVLTFNVYYHF